MALFVLPDSAWAWTPGTHIWLGETILANLHLLPASVSDLLHAFPYDFLYGSIAPDISFAKRYVPPGRHSHFWHVGQEVYADAPSDAMKAFGLGYLAHLSADTMAHNFYVPRQLLLTSSTRSMGHSYWEIRAETHLTDEYARKARDIIRMDHAQADRHLERIISPTIFSVPTNRRIFRGMVHLAHTRTWQRAMQAARERSRWLLTNQDLEQHLGAAYDATVEVLADEKALARRLDPSGHLPLSKAKAMRRSAILRGAWYEPERLVQVAQEQFGLPALLPGYFADSAVKKPWELPAPAHALAEESQGDRRLTIDD
ncbi:MAG TPA: zinc dependent phospholipase C family protein [Gemmatimonadales bacterium]